MLQKMVTAAEDENCQVEIRTTRAEKESIVKQRKKIDADLRCHNEEIAKQMAHLTKLQSNLQYKSEDRIRDAIHRLDYHLSSRNFTLSEEKKIVAEIDRLKRSKKVLEEYLILKKEIDEKRDQQKKLREERDLKTKEDHLRKQKTRSELLKKEIDKLYEQKRTWTAQFKVQEREYQLRRDEVQKKFHTELTRKKSHEKQAQHAALRRERWKFLSNCDTNTATTTNDVSSANSASSVEGNTSRVKDLEADGLYVLKKKDEDLFTGITRSKTKRSKRDKRKQSPNKPIVHLPEIFTQFASLGLTPPSTLTEVASAVNMLDTKTAYYTEQQSTTGGSATTGDVAGNSDHDGSAESTICESVPSTPDVQTDNVPPTFPTGGSTMADEVRRFSRDSGTCEFDGMGCFDDSAALLNDGKTLSPVSDNDDATCASCLRDLQLDYDVASGRVTASPKADVVLNSKCGGDDEINARNKLQDANDLQPGSLIDAGVSRDGEFH
ncbi:hypothetical protein NP493_28g04018 [Ridgeia piscesae]|uniref:Uncharacterized protein n=1 Tax=Ridgeia piscesae TaxID=27915 RepID=A0AAD9PD86_RIDPI|nr:hypothetical protein NP493_28g04018 [Ridgeia piscesae]